MPGPLFHVSAVATCTHGAPVQTVSANARVLVSGMPVAVLSDTYPIAGCPFQVPVGAGTKPQPCVQVKWLTPAVRVLVNGQPPVLAISTGLCQSAEQIPQGPPTVVTTQARALGT